MSDINKNAEEIPLEKENLTHITNLEDPCGLENRDPNFDKHLVLQPSITTTNEILGPDKRKVQFI